MTYEADEEEEEKEEEEKNDERPSDDGKSTFGRNLICKQIIYFIMKNLVKLMRLCHKNRVSRSSKVKIMSIKKSS